MAKVKYKDLGTVVKVFDSGIVKTDKGIKACIKAEKGDKLKMDNAKKISIVKTKVKTKQNNIENPDVTEEDLNPMLDVIDGEKDAQK